MRSSPWRTGVSPTSEAMMIRFQMTGASAGTLKCSNELSIPTTTPDSASSSTIGNISR